MVRNIPSSSHVSYNSSSAFPKFFSSCFSSSCPCSCSCSSHETWTCSSGSFSCASQESSIWTFPLLPHILDPSSSLVASSASLGSSIRTNAKPGGRLAIQTFLTLPNLSKASSNSLRVASSPKSPIYTLHSRGQSPCLLESIFGSLVEVNQAIK